MKQVKVNFPAKEADRLATELYLLNCITMFSWANDELFADTKITAIIAVPDENVETFNSKFQKFIVK